jgi:hypothetical protein
LPKTPVSLMSCTVRRRNKAHKQKPAEISPLTC